MIGSNGAIKTAEQLAIEHREDVLWNRARCLSPDDSRVMFAHIWGALGNSYRPSPEQAQMHDKFLSAVESAFEYLERRKYQRSWYEASRDGGG